MSGTTIECVECGRRFIWSYEQQRDFRARGWDPPKRCPACRSQRRYERQSGMRGIARPTLIWSDSSRGTRIPLVDEAPSIPLWRDLSKGERYRYVSRFMNLDSLTSSSLTASEIAVLMQWILERRGLETKRVKDERGRLDLELTNKKRKRDEFARLYYEGRGIPINALYDLLNTLQGTRFAVIHCFTVHTFTKAQKKIQDDFPLVIRLVDGEGLERYLQEAQQSYRAELAGRSARRAPRQRKTLIQRLLGWLRGSA